MKIFFLFWFVDRQISPIIGNFLFGCNAVIVAKRVPDIGGDGGYFSIDQAGEWRHIGTALDNLNCNLSNRQTSKVPVKSWCGIVAIPLTLTIASVTFGTPVPVDACALGKQHLLWYRSRSRLVRSYGNHSVIKILYWYRCSQHQNNCECNKSDHS